MAEVVLLFVGITGGDRPSGPGPDSPVPIAELHRVADEINRQAAAIADFRGAGTNPSPASVNWLRGRVQIDGSSPCGIGLSTEEEWEMVLPGYSIDSSGCHQY